MRDRTNSRIELGRRGCVNLLQKIPDPQKPLADGMPSKIRAASPRLACDAIDGGAFPRADQMATRTFSLALEPRVTMQ